MRMLLVSALALGALTSATLAEEPIQLTDVQLDTVTAGQTAIANAIAIASIGGAGVQPQAPGDEPNGGLAADGTGGAGFGGTATAVATAVATIVRTSTGLVTF